MRCPVQCSTGVPRSIRIIVSSYTGGESTRCAASRNGTMQGENMEEWDSGSVGPGKHQNNGIEGLRHHRIME